MTVDIPYTKEDVEEIFIPETNEWKKECTQILGHWEIRITAGGANWHRYEFVIDNNPLPINFIKLFVEWANERRVELKQLIEQQ